MTEAAEVAMGYHRATKHHYDRYARSLGYLDWATQPDPFRRYRGAPLFVLPLADAVPSPPYDALYAPGAVRPQAVTVETLGALFRHSLALSAWKEYGTSRWSLRCNPSSGNLHPTEGYLVAGPVEDLFEQPAVYHYAPLEHGLERRATLDGDAWRAMMAGFPPDTFLVGLTSIHWREAWKYGERAYRYCQHDAGHALAAVALAAAMLGWRCAHLEGLSDASVARLLGVDSSAGEGEAEPEHPDLLLAVAPTLEGSLPRTLPAPAIEAAVRGAAWSGRPNRLSPEHVDWAIIDHVAAACMKPETPAEPAPEITPAAPVAVPDGVPAGRIMLQRRSAVDMDGATHIPREVFYRMLERTLPRPGRAPFDALGPPACAHLGLFVHRVTDLLPGVYALVREPAVEGSLRRAMRPGLLWEKPRSCPEDLPLYVLEYGDARALAAQVSCGQDIAGDGAFSLGMLAEFEPMLMRRGSWYYRRLFWECGAIGQVLYLEAEAAGVRGTGIGCYFDDPVHGVFGLKGLAYQSLYHFTVGGPVEDPRLASRPPYTAERRALAPGWRGT